MFKVFYISNCGYSSNTVKTLQNSKYETKLINMNDYTEDKDYVIISETYSSYPKIFFKVNDKYIFIGGDSELQTILKLLYNLILDPKFELENQKYIDQKTLCAILITLIKNNK